MEPVAYLKTDAGDCRQLQVPGVYSFGRGSHSDFRPNTKSVSKRHALLELQVNQSTGKTEAWLVDCDSTFGTYVGVSPTALEKITERTRLFFGLHLRFGHALTCYQYLEFPELDCLSQGQVPLVTPSSLFLDERSVADTIKSNNVRKQRERVPLRVTTVTEEEAAAPQFPRVQEEPARSRIQDLVNHFEAKSPINSPDTNKTGAGVKRGSSGNLSTESNQMVMEMVTKIEQSPTHHSLSNNSIQSFSGKESSHQFSFRGAPSPETSSKTHVNYSSQTNLISLSNLPPVAPSPDPSVHSRHSQSDGSNNRDPATAKKPLRQDCDWTGIAHLTTESTDTTAAAVSAPTVAAPEVTPGQPVSRTSPSPVTLSAEPTLARPPSVAPVIAPGKEADSGKELDYSIYDYDLDEKLGATEATVPVPVTAFRRNPSLWEDPALFDALQESTSTRSMRSTPLLPSRPLSTHNASGTMANTPTISPSDSNFSSAERPLSLRDQAIADLAQRHELIAQSRHAFCDKKNATLHPVDNQYPTYRALAKQWQRAVASVDPVDGGMCISLVLPFLRKVKIEARGRKKNKVRIEARRQLHRDDDIATDKDSEYICEYKLDGLVTALHVTDISHEYSIGTGLLCVFVNKVTPQDSLLYVEKHDLAGHNTCVPYEPAKGNGFSKWLPSWLRGTGGGKRGPTERHNEQELRRGLKESTKENKSANNVNSSSALNTTNTSSEMEANNSKRNNSRKSVKSAVAGEGVEASGNANNGIGAGAAGSDSQRKRASSSHKGSSKNKTESSKNKQTNGAVSESTTKSLADAKSGSGAVVDRASLLQEFIEKGDVDENVEFI